MGIKRWCGTHKTRHSDETLTNDGDFALFGRHLKSLINTLYGFGDRYISSPGTYLSIAWMDQYLQKNVDWNVGTGILYTQASSRNQKSAYYKCGAARFVIATGGVCHDPPIYWVLEI